MICAKGHELDKPFAHVRYSRGCMACYYDERGQSTRLHLEDYQIAASKKGYKCLETERPTSVTTPVKWGCDKGHSWPTSYNNFVHNDTYCPNCVRHESKMEILLYKFLEEIGLPFEKQKKFDDLKNQKHLSYDAYIEIFRIPGLNICIRIAFEADGIQHYKAVDYFGGQEHFEKQKKNDRLKEEYCERNNIALIRIKYDQNVEEALVNGIAEAVQYAIRGENLVHKIIH